MSQDIRRQGIDQPAQNLLVTGNPGCILRIWDGDLFLVGIFSLQGFRRSLVLPINQLKNARTSESRDDKGLPNEGILPREKLGRGAPRAAARAVADDDEAMAWTEMSSGDTICVAAAVCFGFRVLGVWLGFDLRWRLGRQRRQSFFGLRILARQGGVREKVDLATKFGISFADGKWEIRGDPAYVRAACEGSLARLGVDCIDIYYQHRMDTNTHVEITMDEIKKLVEEGKVKYVGLSEASASTIRRAHAVHPITAVQLEWSLWSRDVEEDIIPTCRELGIGIVAYSPLGKGFLSRGAKMVDTLPDDDFRKSLPRFQPENMEKNAAIFERVSEMAARKGCTASQLALAWVHHKGSDVCPIPGTTKIQNFNQNVGALSVKLTPDEMAELESYAAMGAVQGDRCNSNFLNTWKDSETPPLSSWKAT
ncbi:hypothetical protein QYE76_043268 [Lolium multiflorum]|uniref:NADP-dependent oxidoreductase domain-containing protein n=1 Tax=Lolium multiflorum TaxID=4521 RepID=A0AAD8TGX2_LOLMU|nr:hypothetical protein QYE76_043268 [Lolium multiflorum]